MRYAVTAALAMLLYGAPAIQHKAHAADNPMLGEIRWFAGNFAPRGWALCDGQLLAISQFDALFSILGTIYGGDGRTTFGLPDLRGRAPVHYGQGPGLQNRNLGQGFGTESANVSVSQLPSHSHPLNGSSSTATQSDPTANLPGTPQGDNIYTAPDVSLITMHPGSISNTGGNQSHDNMQPSLGLSCIIALTGTYPSRN